MADAPAPAPAPKGQPIKVRALKPGYHTHLREEGHEFEIPDVSHLGSWMEGVGDADKAAIADYRAEQAKIKAAAVAKAKAKPASEKA